MYKRSLLNLVNDVMIVLLLVHSAHQKDTRHDEVTARHATPHATDDGSNRCLWQLNSGESTTRFSSLPGGGWDNLRNKDMGLVADLSFIDCTLSDDGMYVLPRNVILYARKESSVEIKSEIVDHFSNYTSTVSSTINADLSGGLLGYRISGKLSEEYQQVKSVAVANKLKIGKTQLRYRLYSAKIQPDFKLSVPLINRLMDIASALINNRTKLARYLSDLVVRDFGTHAVTSVEAGGVLEKIDYFREESITDKDFMRNKFSASMSVRFLSLLSVNIEKTSDVTAEDLRKYQNSVSMTSVRSHGGPILGASPSLDGWISGLRENLVPVDREGEPLHAVINRRSLPDIPMMYLMQLRKEVEAAITRYYSANTVKGCQDPNSGNFDPVANLDGHCEAPATNFSFAGVFQTCHETNPGAGFELCNGLQQRNPITGGFSCPNGYDQVLLFSTAGRSETQSIKQTTSCWIFFTCDDGFYTKESRSILTAHWCVARSGARLSSHSGMVYGGAYTNDGRFVNEITQSKSCSQFFRPYQIGRDIQLCLSMDLQSAARYRIPFAGFFACNSGNPLADPRRSGLVASSGATAGADAESPKRCPDGFSQVTLDTVDGCAVMQCVKGRSGLSRIPVRRPPFEEPDYDLIESPVIRIESNGWHWGYNFTVHAWSFLGFFGSGSSDISSSSSSGSSDSSVAGASAVSHQSSWSGSTVVLALIGCICGLALLALIVYFAHLSCGCGSRVHRVLHRIRNRRPLFDENSRQKRSMQGYGSLESDEVVCDSQDEEVNMENEAVKVSIEAH